MKLDLHVKNQGKISLTDKNYIGAGGEANIYTKNKTAYKIYHDSVKMIPVAKMQELSTISAANVLNPQNVIYNSKNKPVGYTMAFKKNTHPLCKLFTKSFKNNNNISGQDITKLITEIQKTIEKIHKEGFLIVDLNEMNIIVSPTFKTPYFIDVDSYQTKSYKATAIMESIRDPLIKKNGFTEFSDWFAFAVLSMQLYINIHPYKGRHPDYKPNEWIKRMGDGVSVFNKNVSLPRVCNDFSVIPKAHLNWFKDVFIKNNRSIPPYADSITVLVIAPSTFIKSNEGFDTNLIIEYDENILSAFNFIGVNYVVTKSKIYKENKPLPVNIDGYKTLLCESTNMSLVICKLKDNILVFEEVNGQQISSTVASDMMYKDSVIYSLSDGKIWEHTFIEFGNKILHKPRVACNALENATKIFDGVIFQDLIGKCHITLPYEKGKCLFKPIKELNGYRILEAKAEGNICGIMTERKGVYYRFVLIFNDNFTTYIINKTGDVSFAPIRLTVLPNGVCIMIYDSKVRIFKGDKGKFINNPPFDSSMSLFNNSGNVCFIDKNKIYSAKVKK